MTQPKKTPEIAVQLKQLDDNVDQLHQRISELESDLVCITDDNPTPPAASDEERLTAPPKISDSLRAENRGIDRAIQRIISIRNRLQI